MKIKLLVNNNKGIFDITPFITDKITLTTHRKNSASTLDFKFARDLVVQNNLSISIDEGNAVELTVNDNKIYKGFAFQKTRNKDQLISIKCYDQLRYLQNKQSYTFVDKKASDIIKSIASDFGLITGHIQDTGYILQPLNMDNQRLLDIIMKALDITFYNNNELYIFYDDVGKLTLKKVNDMYTTYLFTSDTNINNFNYTSTIDNNVYNQIKLYKDNEETGKREIYLAKDNANIGNWGILQYYEKLDDNLNTAQAKKLAEDILKQKNKVAESLSIDIQNIDDTLKLEKLRAGNYVYVLIKALSSGDFSKTCLIEKCTHIFCDNEHSIKLELNGGS